MRKIFLCAALICWIAGCQTPSRLRAAEDHALLGREENVEAVASFQKLLKLKQGTPEYEKERIEYLLERLSQSPHTFIRNGTRYSNVRAVIHLRWKYRKKRNEIFTAEGFINGVASHSKTTGEDYLIQIGDTAFPIREAFFSELKLLDEKLKRPPQKVES